MGHSTIVDNNHPTAPRQVRADIKTIEACRLRAKGLSYERVAEGLRKLGHECSGGTGARKLVLRGLEHLRREINETAEDVRDLELQRLDAIFEPQFESAQTGDPRAAEVCLKVLDRRAKMLGLDDPGKWPTGASGGAEAPGLNLAGMDVDKLESLVNLLREAGVSSDGE